MSVCRKAGKCIFYRYLLNTDSSSTIFISSFGYQLRSHNQLDIPVAFSERIVYCSIELAQSWQDAQPMSHMHMFVGKRLHTKRTKIE